MSEYHELVMLSEVLEYLQPKSGQTVIDGTLGGGGHSIEIVKRLLPDGKLIGIDLDNDALKAAGERLSEYSENIVLRQGNFFEMEAIVAKLGIKQVNGVLLDLGVSSYQFDTAERGFSFRYDVPLDMRMNKAQAVTARELVNSFSEKQLEDIIWNYGEERWARRIAKFIVDRRARKPIETTAELVEIVLAAVPSGARTETIHPATKTFQALRIAVNKELESLQAGLDAAISLLAPNGKLVILSYHSLEDRIVKESFARHSGRCECPSKLPICVCGAKKTIKVLTKRPVVASEAEISANPRARSAKLRAAEKL